MAVALLAAAAEAAEAVVGDLSSYAYLQPPVFTGGFNLWLYE